MSVIDIAKYVVRVMQAYLDTDQKLAHDDYVEFNNIFVSESMLRVTCKLLSSGHLYIDTYERIAHTSGPMQGCWEYRKVDYVMGMLERAKHDNIITVLTDRILWAQQEANKKGFIEEKKEFKEKRYKNRYKANGEIYSIFDDSDIPLPKL